MTTLHQNTQKICDKKRSSSVEGKPAQTVCAFLGILPKHLDDKQGQIDLKEKRTAIGRGRSCDVLGG
jgi:hypothetical protein